jgi:hypothetical protein
MRIAFSARFISIHAAKFPSQLEGARFSVTILSSSALSAQDRQIRQEGNKMPISKQVAKLVLIGIAGVLLMAPGGCPPPAPPPPLNTQTLVPTDPCTTNACVPVSSIAGTTDVCPVSSSTFNTWFKPIPPATTGVVTLNGVVNPANSVSFPNIPNCSFYQWAMQDFLWLTSPAPPEYGGGGGLIIDSPTFYDVTPACSGRQPLPSSACLGLHQASRFARRAAGPGGFAGNL